MINSDFVLERIQGIRAKLSWTSANADDVSFVFWNGDLIRGPYEPGTTSRSFEFVAKQGTLDEFKSIEIHDLPSGDTDCDCTQASIKAKRNPILKWTNISAARWFIVYYKHVDDSSYTFYKQIKNSGEDIQQLPLNANLSDGWNLIKITAVDDYGNESSVDGWPHRVILPPDAPTSISATGSGGTFNFSLGGL